jgi:hypothetical protein
MVETASSPERSKPGLFASLLAAPVVWTVYHFIGYLVVETACLFGQLNRPGLLGLTPLSLIVALLTLAALGVTAYSGMRAWRQWRGAGYGGEAQPSLGADRVRFLSFVAALLGFIFSLVILADGVSALALHPCGQPG